MTYRTILAYFGHERHMEQTLRLAVAMARRCDAHLIGLYVIPQIHIEGAVAAQVPASVIETMKAYDRQQADRIRDRFAAVAGQENFVSEWRTVEVDATDRSDGVLQHARMADLVVLAQADPSEDGRDYRELPDRVIMASGRPVVIAPLTAPVEAFGEYVMVAWDGGRESARATFDALPLLAAAKQVYVHSVGPKEHGGPRSALPGAELATALSRHGVTVEASHSVNNGVSIGEELRARAADRGCDLMVMGGYGHSRLSEIVLGGATRSMLRQMPMPILFSH